MEGADAVIKDVKSLNECVGGDVAYVALGDMGCILGVPKWVCEEDAELVKHLDHP